jgi:hypothetical protein
MQTMRKYGIPTSLIYGLFATQAGGCEKVSYSRRDIYTMNNSNTGEEIVLMESMQLIS